MRILVLSDSHRRKSSIRNSIEAQQEAGHIIFLGDGTAEMENIAEEYPNKKIYMVEGNCDYYSSMSTWNVASIAGKKIFFTHGHSLNVKGGLETVLEAARVHGADICLYGHTHEPCVSYKDGIYIMNPGTISGSRTGKCTYGIIDITKAGIVCNIIEL